MFSTSFIKVCLSILVSEKTDPIYVSYINSMIKDFDKYFCKNEKDKFFLTGQDQCLFDLLKWLTDYRMSRVFFDFDVMLTQLETWSLKDFLVLLKELRDSIQDDQRLKEYCTLIQSRKRLFDIFKNKENFNELLRKLESGTFKDDNEIIKEWSKLIVSSYVDIHNLNRLEELSNATEIDLKKDSYHGIFSKLLEQFTGIRVIPTGFNFLDDNVLPLGGLEPKRLYLIVGSSGVGKSMFLLNLLVNALRLNGSVSKKSDKQSVYLYITAENLLDETFLRFYCCLTKTPYYVVLGDLKNLKDRNEFENTFSNMEKQVKTLLESYNSSVIFKYVISHKTTVSDLESLLSDLSETYDIRCLYLDYLDLLSSGQRYSEYYRELGAITQYLKNLSITFDFPLVTATQLNRQGYDSHPSLIHVSESIEKVNKADFVLFLQNIVQKDRNNQVVSTETYVTEGGVRYKVLRCTVLKNRNGSTTFLPSKLYIPVFNEETKRSCFTYSIQESVVFDKVDSSSSIVSVISEMDMDEIEKSEELVRFFL